MSSTQPEDDGGSPKSSPPFAWALPTLEPIYAAALAAKNTAYTRHWLPTHRLQAPVISIGNLSVGGAGKTPLVIRLAELLAERGFDVDVLSRGYGRSGRATERVDPELASAAARYGDEPVLISRAAKVPVYVGAGRFAAGLLAEQRPATGRTGTRVHLLDDGFQHRRLARAVDIVVLHRSDFSAALLPAGRLREPLSALARASVAVLRVEDQAFEGEVRRHLPQGRPIWSMERSVILPPAALPPAVLRPTAAENAAVAFCGIAHASEFFASLRKAGASLAATHAYPDHHAYTEEDIVKLVDSIRRSGAGTLLTTEKDLVRISAAHAARLRSVASLEAVPLVARLRNEDAAIEELLALAGLPGKRGQASEEQAFLRGE